MGYDLHTTSAVNGFREPTWNFLGPHSWAWLALHSAESSRIGLPLLPVQCSPRPRCYIGWCMRARIWSPCPAIDDRQTEGYSARFCHNCFDEWTMCGEPMYHGGPGLVMATPQLARPNKRQRCSETDSPGTYIYACVIYLAA